MTPEGKKFTAFVIGVLPFVLATLVAGSPPPLRPSVLFPVARPAVRAAHAVHAQENMQCSECHDAAGNSIRAKDRLIPAMAICAPCHESEVGDGKTWQADCGYCHIRQDAGFLAKGAYATPRIRFSHKAHGEQSCESCHGASGDSGFEQISMKRCYGCHRSGKRNLTSCRTCHLVEADGRMKTLFNDEALIPPAWLRGPSHGVGWVGNHARPAGRDSSFCANCHREAECTNCHNGKAKNKQIHPSDWVNTHGVHSSMDSPRCMSCHRTQGFCLSCHRRSGVAPDAPTSKRGKKPSRFHGNATPEKICRRARTNITACASCHSESSCISCHAAINPHPAGFSRNCKPLARKSSRACAKCHRGNVEKRCQ